MAQGQLNAGHLGGRFLERTIPQKVNSVPSCETEIAMPIDQKQLPVEVSRRGRKSVAMLGLAISMGAYGLLPQPNDGAIAAEPVPGELSTTEASVNIAAASHGVAGSASTARSSVIEHTVQEGQTLQQLARFYGIDASAVANANRLSLETVLHVGQVLKIPTGNLVAMALQSDSVSPVPEYYGLVPSGQGQSVTPSVAPISGNPDAPLKQQQDEALSRLHQKREGLRASLSQMKPSSPEVGAIAAQSRSVEPAPPALSAEPSLSAEPLKFPEALPEPVPPAPVQLSLTLPQSAGLPSVPEVKPPVNLQSEPVSPQKETVVALTDSVSYRVSAGDTLSAIARSYSIPEEQLAAANKITNPNLIRANQVLTIPQRQTDSSLKPLRSVGSGTFSVASANVPVAVPTALGSALPSDTARMIEARLQQAQQTKGTSEVSPTPLPVVEGNTPDRVSPARVAAAFTGTRTTQSEDLVVPTTVVPAANYSYVENLKAEVLRLRERYSAASSQPAAKVAAVTIDSTPAAERTRPELVNPEFSPKASELKASELSVRPQAMRSQSPQSSAQGDPSASRSQAQKVAPVASSQPQKVATASLGSQSYSSLTSSMLGQMVSPGLPPLGSAEAYLPGKSGKFSGYIWPAQGMLSSGYGWRWGRMHKGIDIAAPVGTPVVAAAGGRVSYADWNSGGYGNLVEIIHPDGSMTLYAHNNRILVREGQEVAQGEQIAEMGSTGYSTGPHSHFEVHLPGQGAVNPISYLTGNGAS